MKKTKKTKKKYWTNSKGSRSSRRPRRRAFNTANPLPDYLYRDMFEGDEPAGPFFHYFYGIMIYLYRIHRPLWGEWIGIIHPAGAVRLCVPDGPDAIPLLFLIRLSLSLVWTFKRYTSMWPYSMYNTSSSSSSSSWSNISMSPSLP